MARREYSDEEKAKALELLRDVSLSYYEVRDKTGVPVGTLHSWARANDIERRSDPKQTRAATERRIERLAAKREALTEKMFDVADLFVDKASDLAEGVVEVREGVFISGGRDARELMTAAAIAIDKGRLELGEATSVNETRGDAGRARTTVEQALDELAAKRKAKAS
jgi:transposase-like protein